MTACLQGSKNFQECLEVICLDPEQNEWVLIAAPFCFKAAGREGEGGTEYARFHEMVLIDFEQGIFGLKSVVNVSSAVHSIV
jgi:hypothetical protein